MKKTFFLSTVILLIAIKSSEAGFEKKELVILSSAKPIQKSEVEQKTNIPRQFIVKKPTGLSQNIASEMIAVEGGTFQMGSDNGQDDEKPIHSVTVSSFYIGKYEVTQREYQKVIGKNPSYFKGDNLPVETVNWWEAIKYCNQKSRNEGLPVAYREDNGSFIDAKGNQTSDPTKVKGYRLPTEAEWEFAARGGKSSQGYLYSGGNDVKEIAWYWDNSVNTTHTVGSKKKNELGIYDLSGNVWEWVSDTYDGGNYGKSNKINPYFNSGDPIGRVSRGGSWLTDANNLRTADRFFHTTDHRSHHIGFRLVRSSS